MPAVVNTIDLYKSTSDFFRNVRELYFKAERYGLEGFAVPTIKIMESKDEFKRNVGKINASSSQAYVGNFIAEKIGDYQAILSEIESHPDVEDILVNIHNSLEEVTDKFYDIRNK